MVLNLNIGILGHVDSGKTTLAKALSTVASTAAFDKNPQSQERKITLDLGFSSATTDAPEHLKTEDVELQLTFVDCPGHASLIRTIIGGAQIVDLILLVIDATKGIQTQTAECLVIAEITGKDLIVVLNKTDVVEVKMLEKVERKVRATLATTMYKEAPFIAVSALQAANTTQLIDLIKMRLKVPVRRTDLPFIMAVDHCFGIKGQGTICTGTVLQGRVAVNDDVEIPKLREVKKVKTIQMFKQSVSKAQQGDRLGCCITQFDPKLLERGIICRPGYIQPIYAAVVRVQRIKYFAGAISSKAKFHMSIGHETILASITLFREVGDQQFEFVETLEPEMNDTLHAVLEFERPVLAPPASLAIGSKFDINSDTKTCRLAFWGRLDRTTADKNYADTFLPALNVFKQKTKLGHVQRVLNDREVIVTGLCKKSGGNREQLIGLKCSLEGHEGVVDSAFGQSAKLKVQFTSPLPPAIVQELQTKGCDLKVVLKFKKFLFQKKNQKIVQ
jgi:selenocysteine-specific elongation factor